MSLYLRESGLFRNDTFGSGLPAAYVAAPVSRVSVAGGRLRLDHDANDDTLVLAPLPGACAVEVKADYTPTEENDQGGLVLYQNADNKIEFLERVDSNVTTNVSRWRAVSTDGKTWDLFADSGSGFQFVDMAAEFVPNKVGAVLKKGTASGYVPLFLERLTITKSSFLTVGNLANGLTVELLDASNVVVTTAQVLASKALVPMPSLHVSGSLRVKNGGTVVDTISGEFYGGDRYDSGSSLKIVKDNVTLEELSRTDLSDVGTMTNGQLLKKLYIHNPTAAPVSSVSVLIEQWNAKFGYQWADVAKDVSGAPGTWGDVISYTSVPANSTTAFWLRVEQQTGYTGLDPLELSIGLQHV